MHINGLAGIDEVNGIIIGGDYVCAQVFYQDRLQGPMLYGDTPAELTEKAETYIADTKIKCGEAYRYIFPLSAWSVRFYNS